MKSPNNSERKPPWPFKRPPNKCGVICIVLGILFLLNAMLSTFFRIPLSDFLGMYENIFLKVQVGVNMDFIIGPNLPGPLTDL